MHHSNYCHDDANEPAFSCKDSDDSSCKSSGTSLDLRCNLNRDEIRKSLLSTVDTFLNSEQVSNYIAIEYHEEVKKTHKRMMKKLKKRSYTKDNGEFEFECDEGIYRSPQKRKQNALDY